MIKTHDRVSYSLCRFRNRSPRSVKSKNGGHRFVANLKLPLSNLSSVSNDALKRPELWTPRRRHRSDIGFEHEIENERLPVELLQLHTLTEVRHSISNAMYILLCCDFVCIFVFLHARASHLIPLCRSFCHGLAHTSESHRNSKTIFTMHTKRNGKRACSES